MFPVTLSLPADITRKQRICYCFNYTTEDIEKDVDDNSGQSSIMERIITEKKEGGCDCAQNNPKGR